MAKKTNLTKTIKSLALDSNNELVSKIAILGNMLNNVVSSVAYSEFTGKGFVGFQSKTRHALVDEIYAAGDQLSRSFNIVDFIDLKDQAGKTMLLPAVRTLVKHLTESYVERDISQLWILEDLLYGKHGLVTLALLAAGSLNTQFMEPENALTLIATFTAIYGLTLTYSKDSNMREDFVNCCSYAADMRTPENKEDLYSACWAHYCYAFFKVLTSWLNISLPSEVYEQDYPIEKIQNMSSLQKFILELRLSRVSYRCFMDGVEAYEEIFE